LKYVVQEHMRGLVLRTAQNKDKKIGSIGAGGTIEYLGLGISIGFTLLGFAQFALPFAIGMPWMTAIIGFGLCQVFARGSLLMGDTAARQGAFLRLISWKLRKVPIAKELGLEEAVA